MKKSISYYILKTILEVTCVSILSQRPEYILYVYFDKQSEIITDVWIFDSMINENFNCLSKLKAISMVPNEIIISLFEEALKR